MEYLVIGLIFTLDVIFCYFSLSHRGGDNSLEETDPMDAELKYITTNARDDYYY